MVEIPILKLWRQVLHWLVQALRWLGLQPVDRARFELDGALAETLQSLAESEHRPAREVAAELVVSGLAQRDRQSDTWIRWESLSPREKQVARLACQGYTNRQIAYTLGISAETAKSHVRRTLTKFNLHSRSELRLALDEIEGEV
jgi:DNA-binding CsgD family transcriptional regulator